MGTCEGYTTPYNESPFPRVLLAMMSTTTNRDTLQYKSTGVRHDRSWTHKHPGTMVNPMGYGPTIIHWCSSYPQYISTNLRYMWRYFTWCSSYPQRSSWGSILHQVWLFPSWSAYGIGNGWTSPSGTLNLIIDSSQIQLDGGVSVILVGHIIMHHFSMELVQLLTPHLYLNTDSPFVHGFPYLPYNHHWIAFITQPSINMSNPDDITSIFEDSSDIEMEDPSKPNHTLKLKKSLQSLKSIQSAIWHEQCLWGWHCGKATLD